MIVRETALLRYDGMVLTCSAPNSASELYCISLNLADISSRLRVFSDSSVDFLAMELVR